MTTSTQPLKNFYGVELAEELARRVQAVHPDFEGGAFVAYVAERVGPLELKDRIATIAAALRTHLPPDYPAALAILLTVLGPANEQAEGMFTSGYVVSPIATFVELYGLDHFDESLSALHAITQRNTAEFAIRPFLIRYPERTMAVLEQWVDDESFHVRRLVSEGMRPRLPWASRLPAFIADPRPILQILVKLKDDPSGFVRRSVANNLNDIIKDHPELVLTTLEQWSDGASKETTEVIRHALRNLIKQGDPAALRLVNVVHAPDVRLLHFSITPETLPMHGTLAMELALQNDAATPQRVIIDYKVHFASAHGGPRAKVFKLREHTLAPGEVLTIAKRHSFKPITTRRYYPGPHRIEIQVNGTILGAAEFVVV